MRLDVPDRLSLHTGVHGHGGGIDDHGRKDTWHVQGHGRDNHDLHDHAPIDIQYNCIAATSRMILIEYYSTTTWLL